VRRGVTERSNFSTLDGLKRIVEQIESELT